MIPAFDKIQKKKAIFSNASSIEEVYKSNLIAVIKVGVLIPPKTGSDDTFSSGYIEGQLILYDFHNQIGLLWVKDRVIIKRTMGFNIGQARLFRFTNFGTREDLSP